MKSWEINVVKTTTHFLRDSLTACGFPLMMLYITLVSSLPLIGWEKSWKRAVLSISASRQHVWLLPFGRKCTREDEMHVKVPGFWRNINLPIRPEITWPDLTLPVCLSRKRERSGRTGGQEGREKVWGTENETKCGSDIRHKNGDEWVWVMRKNINIQTYRKSLHAECHRFDFHLFLTLCDC